MLRRTKGEEVDCHNWYTNGIMDIMMMQKEQPTKRVKGVIEKILERPCKSLIDWLDSERNRKATFLI